MTRRLTQMATVAALSLAASAAAFADIKLNDNFSVGGYAVGSANYNQSKPKEGSSTSTSKLDGDAYKLWSNITFAPVTGTISLYAGDKGDPVILDAYATYDFGSGTKVTAGKFLSWLGYEAFDPTNMTQITYGWATPQGFGVANIPAYHSGVKVDIGNDTYGAGFAVLDSADPGPGTKLGIEKGDGNLKNGPGFEAYYSYKGVKDLTIFLGGFYENDTGINGGPDIKKSGLDLWAQYVVGDTTFAGEISTRKDDFSNSESSDLKSNFWLLEAQQALDKKWTLTARISGVYKKYDGAAEKPSATTFTIAPSFTITPNLQVVAEYSYSKYKDHEFSSGNFIAAQLRFKF